MATPEYEFDPGWVQPGAELVLFRHDRINPRLLGNVTVARVAQKSFKVEGYDFAAEDERFSLATGWARDRGGKGGYWRYAVLPAEHPKIQQMLRARRIDELDLALHRALQELGRGDERRNPARADKLDAAIAALQALRDELMKP